MAAPDQEDQEYLLDFNGDEIYVTVTRTYAGILNWIGEVIAYHGIPFVVGVGVESTIYNRMRRHFFNDNAPADILQLCAGNQCLIIQLRYLEDNVPNVLRYFLNDDRTIFVGFRNGDDARKLSESHHHLQIRQLRDIRNYLPGPDVMNMSFDQIVAEYMGDQGVNLDPEEDPYIDWSVYELDPFQIIQASLDAYVCCELGHMWAL